LNLGGTTDAAFEALWTRCLESWEEDEPHAAVLQYALREQMLPELAGRYRRIKETEEARSERAQKKIDGIVSSATTMLLAQKTPAPTKTPMSWNLAFGALVAFVISWLAYRLIGRH
jgi:hypothetical protein